MVKRPRPKAGRADPPPHRTQNPTVKALSLPGRSSGPLSSSPAPAGPSAEAVNVFRQGMEALQRHEYAVGAAAFRALLHQFPSERPLLDRSRVYLELCQRQLDRKPTEPRTVEERLTAATAALNAGDHGRAAAWAREVLAENPRQDLALYLLAATEARRGALDQALSYLGQAIAVSPEAKAQARHEPDFEALRHLEAFHELTELPPPPSGGAQRSRRGRAER
jgi:tetratricopeptide (TPR) repeat protein